MEPLVRREQQEHAHTFVQGLLSDLDHKNVGVDRLSLWSGSHAAAMVCGVSDWDHEPLRDELVRQVGEQLGEEDGVIVFDPSGFPKSGRESVGVARQWCGRLGKVDNCQVAVFMGYVSSQEHALVDTRLFLPKEWTQDKARREKAGVPKEVRYRTRHQLCWKCSRSTATDCRMRGSPATTKWARRPRRNLGRHPLPRPRQPTDSPNRLLLVECELPIPR